MGHQRGDRKFAEERGCLPVLAPSALHCLTPREKYPVLSTSALIGRTLAKPSDNASVHLIPTFDGLQGMQGTLSGVWGT